MAALRATDPGLLLWFAFRRRLNRLLVFLHFSWEWNSIHCRLTVVNSFRALGCLFLAASMRVLATAQTLPLSSPSPAIGALLQAPLGSAAALVHSNTFPRMPGLKHSPVRPPTNVLRAGVPAPGIYETRPYTCIVVVPGPHPDDGCIIGRGRDIAPGPAPRMPMRSPDLQFVPRHQGSSLWLTNAPAP